MSATTHTRAIRRPDGAIVPAATDRRTLGLAILVAVAPILRMLGVVFHPHDTADAAATIAHIDAVSVQWALVHLLEPYGMLLLAIAGFILLRLTPGKGRRIATAGAVLFGIGCAALAMLVYSHGEAYLFMTHPSVEAADMTDLYAQFDGGIPLGAPVIPAYSLGALLLGVGLFRGGVVPPVSAAVFAVSTIVPMAVPQDNLVISGLLGMAPMVAAMGIFAIAIARQGHTQEHAGALSNPA